MVSMPLEEVRSRAEHWQREIGCGEVIPGESTLGGGSLPGESFPTWLLALKVKSPDKFLAKLRKANPPIIARTENDKVLLDPRTVFPEQEPLLVSAIQSLLSEQK
jgi:L-seryl-tRNA(Ser) seleniumtransferase